MGRRGDLTFDVQFAKVGGNTPVEPGADERRVIVKWLAKTIRNERRALEHARRRFVEKPSEKRLHDVRTTGRRFRSLLEDVADLVPAQKLLSRVKRAAATTDAARDATVIRQLLERSTDAGEAAIARPVLDELRHQEAIATRLARKRLRRTRFLP
jgi:CHAD domain-containing protein